MGLLSPLLFGALCALSALPCFLFIRFNRIEGTGSAPPPRDHRWSGVSGQWRRHRNRLLFFPALGGLYAYLQKEHFIGVEFESPALLGFTCAQGLFWALILAFAPALREDRSELSERASARARRRRTKPSLWLSLGLGLTVLGTLLLFPGGIPIEWSGRFGVVLLAPMQLILGFLCVSSMFRVVVDDGARWGFLIAFLVPPCVALVAA